jgi:hypothetical protein
MPDVFIAVKNAATEPVAMMEAAGRQVATCCAAYQHHFSGTFPATLPIVLLRDVLSGASPYAQRRCGSGPHSKVPFKMIKIVK